MQITRKLHFKNYLLTSKKDKRYFRILETLPATLAWSTLIGGVVFSFIYPALVAIFIIVFDVYWLIRVIYLSGYLILSYRVLKTNVNTNWLTKVKKDFAEEFENIYHLIILPTLDEGEELLKMSFDSLVKSNYSQDKMIIVLAGEARSGHEGIDKLNLIKEKYQNYFKNFVVTIHPEGLPDEIPGKGSNEAYAAKIIRKYIDEERIDYENVILSVFDADTAVHSEFFGRLTHAYLSSDNKLHSSYQPIPMFFNNIWDAPALSRVVAFGTTFWQMMEQGRPERLYTFSSHSMSFKTLVDIGYWETNVVSEDSRIFWQCFNHYRGNYKSTPLHMPIYMDTVLADTVWRSFVNQYKQQMRWAYGAENIPYILTAFRKLKNIPWQKKLLHSFYVIEGSHSWATNALLIFGLGWLPIILGGDSFNQTVLAQSLPFITQILMTLAMVGMFVSAALSFLLLPKPKQKSRSRYFGAIVFQWILLPISTIFFGALPALHAQTKLMLGRYMGFWSTEKVRKS
ncbi:MAG: glycosyltransferase family 2 protein [bacterium]